MTCPTSAHQAHLISPGDTLVTTTFEGEPAFDLIMSMQRVPACVGTDGLMEVSAIRYVGTADDHTWSKIMRHIPANETVRIALRYTDHPGPFGTWGPK